MTITREQWENTPADYKLERADGTRAVLILEPTHGTCLVDVTIKEA